MITFEKILEQFPSNPSKKGHMQTDMSLSQSELKEIAELMLSFPDDSNERLIIWERVTVCNYCDGIALHQLPGISEALYRTNMLQAQRSDEWDKAKLKVENDLYPNKYIKGYKLIRR